MFSFFFQPLHFLPTRGTNVLSILSGNKSLWKSWKAADLSLLECVTFCIPACVTFTFHVRSAVRLKMAAAIGSPPGFQELFTNISFKLNPAQSKDVVQSLKRNYGGKFNSLDDQNVFSSLQLLLKQGFVSDNKLTLIEKIEPGRTDQGNGQEFQGLSEATT